MPPDSIYVLNIENLLGLQKVKEDNERVLDQNLSGCTSIREPVMSMRPWMMNILKQEYFWKIQFMKSPGG